MPDNLNNNNLVIRIKSVKYYPSIIFLIVIYKNYASLNIAILINSILHDVLKFFRTVDIPITVYYFS